MNPTSEYVTAVAAQREFLLWVELTQPHLALETKNGPAAVAPTEAEIQHAAYLLWIETGRPEGRDLAHWAAAKAILCRSVQHFVSRRLRKKPPVKGNICPAAPNRVRYA